MRSLAEIDSQLDSFDASAAPVDRARALLAIGEQVLEHWIVAHDAEPTQAMSEGFRLLALHRQAARGEPSFNACRETCRELVYHHNLIMAEPEEKAAAARAAMMRFVASHLYLFVAGKMQNVGLGEFCCSSRDLRSESA